MAAGLFTFRALVYDGGQTQQIVPTAEWPTVTIRRSTDGFQMLQTNSPTGLFQVSLDRSVAYDIIVSQDGPNYHFVQWTNLSTDRTQVLNADLSLNPPTITFNCFFSTTLVTPGPTAQLTVTSVNTATGANIPGLFITIDPVAANNVVSLFTPGYFTLLQNQAYQLTAHDYTDPATGTAYVFRRWTGQADGAGYNPLVVTLTANYATTAYYEVTPGTGGGGGDVQGTLTAQVNNNQAADPTVALQFSGAFASTTSPIGGNNVYMRVDGTEQTAPVAVTATNGSWAYNTPLSAGTHTVVFRVGQALSAGLTVTVGSGTGGGGGGGGISIPKIGTTAALAVGGLLFLGLLFKGGRGGGGGGGYRTGVQTITTREKRYV